MENGIGKGRAARGTRATTVPVDSSRSAAPRLRLDPESEQLWRDNRLVPLQPKQYAVLRYLIEHAQRLVKKEELLREFWSDAKVGEAVLKTTLAEIRRALGDSAETSRCIATVPRRGYRFIGQVETCTASAQALFASGDLVGGSLRNFVGRQAELDTLRAALGSIGIGQRQMFFISGEPGIGKSTLIEAFLASQDIGAFWIGRGQCVDQYGTGEAYMPFFEVLGRLGRGPHGDELRDLLSRHAPSCLSQLSELRSDSSAEFGSSTTLGASPERMLREMAQALEALAGARPLLLVIEDLQWADYSSLDLVSYLAQRSGSCRLLLLGTYRSLPVEAGNPRWRAVLNDLCRRTPCRELELPTLTATLLAEYLSRRFPRNRLPSGLGAFLAERTSGNPLFAVKVVEAWLAVGLLREVDGEWRLLAELGQLSQDVPASVLQMIEAECARLSSFERSVLEAASVAGATFSTASVAAGLEADIVQVEEVCSRLARRRHFIALGESSQWADGTPQMTCRFVHALYHQVLYERIGATLRSQLHRRVAERLEIGYAQRAGSIAAELASHFERGREPLRAIRYRRLAGEQAMRSSAGREAVVHYTHALRLIQHVSGDSERILTELGLQMALGTALSAVRGYGDADLRAAYARAQALCELAGPTPHLAAVLGGLGCYYLYQAEFCAARAISAQLRTLQQLPSGSHTAVDADALLGVSSFYLGEFGPAREHLSRANGAYVVTAGRFDPIAQIQEPATASGSYLGLLLTLTGYPDQGLRLAERIVRQASELEHPITLAIALYYHSTVQQQRGDNDAARKSAEALQTLSQEQGFPAFLAFSQLSQGVALVDLDDVETGGTLIALARTRLDSLGAAISRTRIRAALANARSLQARHGEAESLLEEAFDALEQTDERYWEAECHRIRGDVLERAQRQGARSEPQPRANPLPASPAACYRRAVEVAQRSGARLFELRALVSLAQLGDLQSSERQRLVEVVGGFTEGHETADLIDAKRMLRELNADARGGSSPSSPRACK